MNPVDKNHMKKKSRGSHLLTGALLTAALGGFASTAHALVYTCIDKGRTLTSDRPIAECANQQMRELLPSGVVRIIPAPLTAEQKQAQDIELNKKRLAEDLAREQVRKDRALLASYSNVEQIEAARQRSLQDANEVIASGQERLALLEKDRQGNLEDAKKYQGKTLPPLLQKRMDDTDSIIALEQRSMASSKANLDRINQRYDAERKRYLELTSSK
jgi:hypothetical protein